MSKLSLGTHLRVLPDHDSEPTTTYEASAYKDIHTRDMVQNASAWLDFKIQTHLGM